MSSATGTAAAGSKPRIIKVDALARVEGEGALYVRVKDDIVKDIKFRIFEPPRFFEALLRGRRYTDAPDITARICGICPVAYLMGASQAMEEILGIEMTPQLQNLRRLLYCGEWIQSHVLHAAMLHAPDFLGLDDALQLAKSNPEIVKKALRLKKAGNSLMEIIGGRAVHPVNTRIGGFYRAPDRLDMMRLVDELKWGVEASIDIAKVFGTFDFPDFDYDYTCVSLRHPDEYAIERGNIVTNRGLNVPLSQFLDHFEEKHVAHSNALHGVDKDSGEPYLVGPIARYNNNYEQLSDLAKQTAQEVGLGPVVTNPFKSLLVRMVETVYAFEEAARLAQAYEPPSPSFVEAEPKAGRGYGCTEAPRGICFHTYALDKEGRITDAMIMPPTSQNQPQIERDLLGVVQKNLALDDEALKWRCEQTIRNYDPCISCATHFLKLTVERE
ncbi:MAG: Ni/Fe hydrogenase subunit alpha [Alphaproteobacteria bacterium]|jgi:coenzyme F420-reducing hydrogenase alpha subunit|nr:Ni/Fe hydrogenase subunit alpha [Alphaproteobacteria bacterium]